MKILYIALFGLAGVFARYGLGMAIARMHSSLFPWGTFIINLTGSFGVGIVYVFAIERLAISEDLAVGIVIGFLGGFTTFSAYALELTRLLESTEYFYACLYCGLSTGLGVASCAVGVFLARRLWSA